MFSKFSKFRSKVGSRTDLSQQRDNGDDELEDVFHLASYGKPQAPRTPPIAHRRTPSLLGNGKVLKPNIPVVAPLEPNYDTDDTDDSISFAETLFPVTPSVRPGRKSSESSWSSEGVHDLSRRGSWEYKRDHASMVESRRTSWDPANSKRLEKTVSDWTSSSLPEEEEFESGPPVLPAFDDAEEEFLEEFEDYFNNLQVDHIRRDQYPKLDLQKLVYLDYASFALYSKFQVLACTK